MPLTIRQIAEAAGVSKAAVSYVINGRSGVSEETRRRILDIMESTGYRPNPVARGLARQRTETLGLVIPDISDMFYADIIRAVESAASESSFTLNLCTTRSDPDKERDVVDLMTSGRVDGALLMTYHLDSEYFEALKERGTPFVLLGNSDAPDDLYSVSIDNVQAGYEAARHLIELGHRRIAFIHGSRLSRDTWHRFAGFRRALKEHGIACDSKLVAWGDFQRDGGYRAARELLALPSPPTAVFAANDQMAIGVISALVDAGVPVPGNVSVIGVDDIEAASTIAPPLTTVKQPTFEMGRLAVSTLFKLLDGEKPAPRKVLLPPKLVVRESCRAV